MPASITRAVEGARSVGGFSLKIEVECQSEAEADEAIEAGADIVMLDNFDGPGLKVAAKNLKERWKGKRQMLLECSGGLTEANVGEYITNGEMATNFGGERVELTVRQISISFPQARSIKECPMSTSR